MSARQVDAGLWARPRKRAYEENTFAPQRYQDKFPMPVELNQHLNPRGATEMLTCPVCGRIRQYNPRIAVLSCGVCELIWYRGRRYRMRAWDRKWERKVQKNVMGLPKGGDGMRGLERVHPRQLKPTTPQGWLKYAMIGIAVLMVASLQEDYMSSELLLGIFVVEAGLAAGVLFLDYLEQKAKESAG